MFCQFWWSPKDSSGYKVENGAKKMMPQPHPDSNQWKSLVNLKTVGIFSHMLDQDHLNPPTLSFSLVPHALLHHETGVVLATPLVCSVLGLACNTCSVRTLLLMSVHKSSSHTKLTLHIKGYIIFIMPWEVNTVHWVFYGSIRRV